MVFGARTIGTRGFGDSTGDTGSFISTGLVSAQATLAGSASFDAAATVITPAFATLNGSSSTIGVATVIDVNIAPVVGNQPTFFPPRLQRFYPDFDVDDWPNEVQTVSVGGSGLTSFTLTFDGQTTGSIPANATFVHVYEALIALSNIAPDEISVTGPEGGPWVVTFQNGLGHQDVPTITSTPSGGSGTIDTDVTVPGVEPPAWWTPDAVPLGPMELGGIEVSLVDLTNEATPLTGTFGKFWQDQLETDGSGGLTSPDDLGIDPGQHVLRFKLDGHGAFQSLVSEIEQTEVAQGEESDQVFKLTGPGAVALLGRASVAPEFGFYPDDTNRRTSFGLINDIRYFNFSSRYLDDSLWKPTVYNNPDYNNTNIYGRAIGMADLGAQELWDRAQSLTANAPGGFVYFRQWFTDGRDPDDTPLLVRVEGAADDEMELWIDNKPILDITGVYSGSMKYTIIELPPGQHLVAWRGRNRNALRAMTVWSIGIVDSKGRFDEVIAHSDAADAVCLPYPVSPPGFTVGQAFRQLMLEAQGATRQEIPYLTTSFGSFYDSDGTPWPLRSDLSCRLDASLLDACRSWGESYWEFAMASYGFELHAWLKGQRGTDVFAEWNTGDEITSKVRVRKSVPNVAIVRYDTGMVEVRHPSAKPLGLNDPNIITLQMGHIKSPVTARREGLSYLNAQARRGQTITLGTDNNYFTPEKQVYAGAWVGDSPLVDGERLRIHGINVNEEEDLYTVVPEVSSAALTAEERDYVRVHQMNPGSGAGASRATTPAEPVGFPEGREGSEYDLPFSWEEGTGAVVLRAGGVLLATVNPPQGGTERYVLPTAYHINALTRITVTVGSSPSMQKTTENGTWIVEFVVDRDAVNPERGAASIKIA